MSLIDGKIKYAVIITISAIFTTACGSLYKQDALTSDTTTNQQSQITVQQDNKVEKWFKNLFGDGSPDITQEFDEDMQANQVKIAENQMEENQNIDEFIKLIQDENETPKQNKGILDNMIGWFQGRNSDEQQKPKKNTQPKITTNFNKIAPSQENIAQSQENIAQSQENITQSQENITDEENVQNEKTNDTSIIDTIGEKLGIVAPPGTETAQGVKPADIMYNRAIDQLESQNFRDAAKEFEEIERQHPYSQWAIKSILMGAYAKYLRNDYDGAVLDADRFISLHPSHQDTPYAYYLIAMSYYERIQDVTRDQDNTQQAKNVFIELMQRYPNSEYAKDASQKLILVQDHLAGKEMEVGRYYLQRQAHIGAINRFKKVIKNFQTTSHAPEALLRLTEAYLALGIISEAQTAAAILGHNYPDSKWYKNAYDLVKNGGGDPKVNNQSWIAQIFTKNP